MSHRPQDPGMARLARTLRSCARAVAAGTPAKGAGHTMLTALGYAQDTDAAIPRPDRAALLRAAAGTTRLFQLQSAAAPGLAVFGAEIDPAALPGSLWDGPTASVSGTGPTTAQAFESCIGEAAELLSQYALRSDAAHWHRASPASLGHTDFPIPPHADCDVLPATRLADGTPCLVPADLCLRRPAARRDFTAPYPLSIGCAAGPTVAAATLRALLELVERDAAALWWRGGARGHALRLEDQAGAADLLAALRRGHAGRQTWLLDITTDLAIPCVAALSCAPDGRGLAAGFAARPALAESARAAILELCQMELATQLAAAKRREGGDAALNPRDRAHLRRARDIDAASCPPLHPLPPRAAPPPLATGDDATAVSALTQRLTAAGLAPLAVDLTRPRLAIPVIRVLCPGLAQEPSSHVGARLAAQIAQTGGAATYTNGIDLM